MKQKFTQRSYDTQFSTLQNSYGITFNKQNQQIIVTSEQSPCVSVTSRTDFEPLFSFGNDGKNIWKFNCPKGMCIQPFTNHLLITDDYNNKVQIFDFDDESKYNPSYIIGSNLKSNVCINRPRDICCDVDGSMAVTNFNDNVHFLDTSGRYISSLYDNPKYASGLILACYSNSYAQQRHFYTLYYYIDKLRVWDTSSNHRTHNHLFDIPLIHAPRGVCCDLNGYVYISYVNNSIEIREPKMNYSLLQTLKNCYLDGPKCMCVDDTNTLMVVNTYNNNVLLFK